HGRQDVALLAVRVVDERDPRAPVGVVLDRRHPAGNADLVALEVDDPVELLVAAAAVADGDTTADVAAAALDQVLDQRPLRPRLGDLVERGDRHEAAARAGGVVLADGHVRPPAPRGAGWRPGAVRSSHTPSNRSLMRWPGARVTTAFFQCGLCPMMRRLP